MQTTATSLKSFKDVQDFLNAFVAKNMVSIGTSPHQDFWNGPDPRASYKLFTEGNIPGLDGFGLPDFKILVKGDSKSSNIILALQGKVAPFDSGSLPGPMPPPGKGLPMSAFDIKLLSDWIDGGCQE